MKQSVTRQQKRTWLWATLLAALIGGLCVSWAASSPLLVGIGGWAPATALPQALASRNAVVHDGYVYLIGGKNISDSPVGSIYSGLIKSDGNVDAWNVAGQLAVPVYLHAVAASTTHLYVIGGWDGGRTRSEVWSAPFATGGGLGAFQKVNDYPVALDLQDAVVAQNRIYVLGGWTGREALNAVHAAEIQPNGALGPWTAVAALPNKLYRLSAAAHNNVIYVTGGYDGAARANVYMARARSDGGLDPWQETTALPNPIYYQETVIHDGRVLVLGGKNDGAEFNQVYSANINSNGTLAGWGTEPALPESLYRFAAVTITRGSDFVMVLGGLHNVDYRNTVYHSSVPNPPTPTTTPTTAPTPTATPVPVQGVSLHLRNEPAHWVGPEEEILYTIAYSNPSTRRVTNVTISDVIPQGVELVAGSVQVSPGGSVEVKGTQPGSEILWALGDLAAGATGQVSYRVRRTVAPPPAVPRPLAISVSGPENAQPNQPIEYTISLTNSTFLTFTNLVIVDTLPLGSRYVGGADSPPVDNKATWNIPLLLGEETIQRKLLVEAEHSLVNYSYFVSSDEGPTAKGRTVVVTAIDNTIPPEPGDGVTISNTGATASWEANNQRQSLTSNNVYNPGRKGFLPLVKR